MVYTFLCPTHTASEAVPPVNEGVDVLIGYFGQLEVYVAGSPLITRKEGKTLTTTGDNNKRILLTKFIRLLTTRNVGVISIIRIGELNISASTKSSVHHF